ncbi:hypothetical protein ENU1_204330 [Entamoeba nuttalli P19]|uniref:Uncharacterized protein n=1 Tax=Entamoeba nuttalli (strain P19) TaxID=1076696 RepID=K2GQM7_ENTNP|nr:hypothetical protein ENU1_204330 [Entamoeba nuttalli P19]EKE37248.1 hypothetical protein ENU1_204330 [Entamoeba nuttalli P19]|eukprot:XP_008860431.1 hypothetical protein ENU1_204330 [Entamoeba nuttalli P19]
MENIIQQQFINYTQLLAIIDSGKFQEQLAKWYLQIIENGVVSFVTQEGVKMSIIGKDYNTKPTDLNEIKRNCDIFDKLLDPKNEDKIRNELVIPITSIIYPIIKQVLLIFRYILLFVILLSFIFNSLIKYIKIFRIEFNIPLNQSLNLTSTNSFQQKVIGDYLYLSSLMDETKVKKGKTEVDVVTFVGLIYNCLIRMTCECKTSYKHWSQ